MGLIYDSGSICPQHWRNGGWMKTGDINPLPNENFIWNGTTWVPVSATNPLPVSMQVVTTPSTAPSLSASGTGNTLPSGTYYVRFTWVTPYGETLPSPEASQAITLGQALNITLPTFPAGVTSANIYVGTTSGGETKQLNTTSTSVSITAPLTSGTAMPTVSTANPSIVVKGTAVVTDNPIAVSQAPKASYQTLKTFTGTITVGTLISDPGTAPTLSASGTGNTLPSGTYYVRYTWVSANGGESKPSPEASQAVASGQALNVTLPAFPSGVVSANIYVSTSSGTETLQRNITTTSTSFTAPLSAGTAMPTVSTLNTIVQNLYTVTSGKTFYLTDFVACNNTNAQVQVSINASQTAGASPVFIGHALNTAPLNALNIGSEPSVAGGTPVTFQVLPQSGNTTITYFVSGYEQ